MIKWVESSAETFEAKKKHITNRACDSCRRKKKRCLHEEQAETPASKRQDLGPRQQADSHTALRPSESAANTSPRPFQRRVTEDPSLAGHAEPSNRGIDTRIRRPSGPQQPRPYRSVSSTIRDARGGEARFVGNMNPEGVFMVATSPETLRGSPTSASVGLWVSHQADDPSEGRGRQESAPSSTLLGGCSIPMQQVILPVLERYWLSAMPTAPHLPKLKEVFFHKFHSLFPVIDRTAYESLPQDHKHRFLLEQGMCLLVSADATIRANLLLADSEEILTCAAFGRQIFAAMRVAIEIGLVTDKLVLIQALALMSMYSYGRESSDCSAMTLARAIQDALSLGLHVPKSSDDTDHDHHETLFCCVWMLDRLHASLLGKPMLLHERDIERSLIQCFDAQKPSFRLLLHVVELIDKVTTMYRPRSDAAQLLEEFPLFEDLVTRYGCSALQTGHVVTIEILYNAIAILSCPSRPDDAGKYPSAAERSRQALSSVRVTGMVESGEYDHLVLFPFVPYAISLSLSLNYREMRKSKVPVLRGRARVAFETNCNTLKQLGSIFISAASMAELGLKTLKEVDRVYLQAVDDSQKQTG